MDDIHIGIIGGSGLYDFDGLEILEERVIDTPFGAPSDAIIIGRYEGRKVAFLPRHGRGHLYNPTRVPYRANIWALKSLGVFWLVTVSATGSLREDIEPEHFVIPDQVIDRTRHRADTFYDDLAVHVGFSHPYNPPLRQILLEACRAEESVTVHDGGTYVCMEGPLFSTKAESEMHRSWGASLIGMTALPEAKLAREAEMAYATIALATDYDVWYEDEYVSVEAVIQHIKNNVANVQRVLKRIIPSIPLGSESENDAYNALNNAVMTAPHLISDEAWAKVSLFLARHIDRS